MQALIETNAVNTESNAATSISPNAAPSTAPGIDHAGTTKTSRNAKINNRFLLTAIGMLLGPAIWIGLKQFGLVSDRYLPAPSAVLSAIWEIEPNVFCHLAYTAFRLVFGFVAGVATGVLLGVVINKSQTVGPHTQPHAQLHAIGSGHCHRAIFSPVVWFFRNWKNLACR